MPHPTVCFFSKHLPGLNYDQLGKTIRDLGFDGVDLTVRTGGHVLPVRAAEDLPRAVDRIRSHGLTVPMITTELVSAEDRTARPILKVAGQLKIPFFKLGYWQYGEDVVKTIAKVRSDVRGLVELAREYGITAGFHNHTGNVGSAIWDGREIIRGLDASSVGYYFDMHHATAEGGDTGWQVSVRIAAPRIKMVAVKDFYWHQAQGQWRRQSCRLGEGMVDVPGMLAMLKDRGFCGPISLHQEYQSNHQMTDIRKDLETLRQHLNATYGT